VFQSLRTANGAALALCVLFLVAGSLWIWRPGIQQDEALFAAGIYPPISDQNSIRVFKHRVPLMVMTYVGTLKATIYRGLVFPFFEPSAVSVRVPALLIGTLSVWLFYRLTLRVLGTWGALFGTALLATDASYLLTIRWDWGPVALQHLCLIGGVLGVVRFSNGEGLRWLAAGFFLFGLGMWDKALFSWSLIGLGVATLLVAPHVVRELLRPRNAAIAAAAFLAGALPLLIYNVRHDWITFRGNTRWSSALVGYKARLVWDTVEGSSLLGNVPREDWEGPIVEPSAPGERVILMATQLAGSPRASFAGALLVLSLLLMPFARGNRRAIGFVLIFAVVLWLQMAFLEQAGTGVHHSVLLWPAPQFITAAALSGSAARVRRGRALAMVLVIATCASSLLVIGTHYTNMIRNGGVREWTEAIWPAVDAVKAAGPTELCVVDWGFFEPFRLLHKGKTRLAVLNPAGNDNDRAYVRAKLREDGVLFISHTQEQEIQQGTLKRFLDFMDAEGMEPADLRVFNDLNGRPTIQLFRAAPKRSQLGR
jgi:hypothetical protein